MFEPAIKMNVPEFRILPDESSVAQAVVDHVVSALRARPLSTLGLATGRTFLPIYSRFVEKHRQDTLLFANTATFNLDEYVGLADDHPASYRSYMRTQLFEPVGLPPEQTMIPGVKGNIELGCAAFEAEIVRRGGIDIQLLGIGRNGHIGFNEPGSRFDSRTRQVELTASTVEANARDFPAGEAVPSNAVTMGIGTILDAGEVIIVATGRAKANAIARAFGAPPDLACPASALQLHPRVAVYCDEAAAGLLTSSALTSTHRYGGGFPINGL